MEQGNYYRHSGAFSAGGLALAAAAGGFGVALVASVRASLVLYLPVGGIATFLLAVAAGIAAGFVSGTALQWGKLRNDALSVLLAGVLALEAGSLFLLSPPPADLPWALWVAEAFIVLGITFFMCVGMTSIPFCERCERWCELEEDVARFAACEEERLESEAAARPLDFLESLGRPRAKDRAWLRADLYTCPSCRDTHVLSLSAVKLTIPAKEGERPKTENEVLRDLLVPTPVAEAIRRLA